MVRLMIWTLLVLVSQTTVAVMSWSDRALVETLQDAFSDAMIRRTEESLAALQLAADQVDAHAIPLLIAAVAATLAMIGWLHSAAVLVARNHLGYLRHGTGWAIGAWFVPFLNLVRVPSIAADVFRAARTSPPAGLVVGLWWLFWAANLLLGRYAAGTQSRASTPEDYEGVFSVLALADITTVGAAVMSVVMALLVTSGLRNTRSLVTSSAYEFERRPAGGFPAGHWGDAAGPDAAPAPDARFGTPPADPGFGAAPVPQPVLSTMPPPSPADRFGAPVPTATPVGPPEPWLAPPPAPVPAPGLDATSATPSAPATPMPPPVVAPPVAPPVAQPVVAPAPAEPGSPYPTTGVFYPR